MNWKWCGRNWYWLNTDPSLEVSGVSCWKRNVQRKFARNYSSFSSTMVSCFKISFRLKLWIWWQLELHQKFHSQKREHHTNLPLVRKNFKWWVCSQLAFNCMACLTGEIQWVATYSMKWNFHSTEWNFECSYLYAIYVSQLC